MDNKFSVIIPCYNKADTIARTLQSLVSQTYDHENFEVIVIDDGSTDESKEVIKSFMRLKFIKAYFMPKNYGRLAARNLGMKMAKNDWICWLDADDEYFSNYLETYNDYINRFPDYKIFNSGMLLKDREFVGDTRYESGWRVVAPLFLKEDHKEGMESFEKGLIGTGSFVFHRDLIWLYPEDVNGAYGYPDSFPAKLAQKDVRFEAICGQNSEGQWLPLGNPFGDDYAYFWYLTRFNKSKCINALLYIAHIRK